MSVPEGVLGVSHVKLPAQRDDNFAVKFAVLRPMLHTGRLPASAAKRGLDPAASSPASSYKHYAEYLPASCPGDPLPICSACPPSQPAGLTTTAALVPTGHGRKGILRVHARGKPCGPDVGLDMMLPCPGRGT